jgi:26S proteasome regulatory subunit N9
MEPEVIANFLADQRDNASADLQHYFITFEDYWERKLWHELTNTLVAFFNDPESASQRLPVYNTFIKTFADKINQLKLVELGLRAATQCQSE